MNGTQPLSGMRILDLTSLLPGPLATLMLAEAGAEVLKVERPGIGDAGRVSRLGAQGENIEFAMINRGKSSMALDLKADRDRLIELAKQADVLVEQFRPGVMDRLGLGYAALSAINPRLIYCSITGYGQTGPMAKAAGHDLNYVARTGMLAISVDSDGLPVMPQGHFADIGGGTFPAVVNILMALLQREKTGTGCHIDIAMCENSFAWMRRGLAPVLAGRKPPEPGRYPHAGGTPRYAIYPTADGALSVAGLEQPFWNCFCDLIGLDAVERDDRADAEAVRGHVARRLLTRTADQWMEIFAGEDVCVEKIVGLEEAVKDPHFEARGVFAKRIALHDGTTIPALPVPISPQFRSDETTGYPELGGQAGFTG